MYDGGIDAESLSSTIDFLLNETSSNGICPIQGGPIDLDLPFHKKGNDTLMEGFDPQIREESSDEEASTYDVTRSIKQALGDYSNATIEECVNTNERTSEVSAKSATEKAELKKHYDLLRESVNLMSLQNSQDVKTSKDEPIQENASASQDSISTETPQEERTQGNKEVPNQRHNQKSKKKRYKYKNVAMDSILGISNGSTIQPAVQVNAGMEGASSSTAKTFVNAVKPAVLNGVKPAIMNGARPPGRGRLYDNSRRNNMIRPECIIGYDSNPDYNPNYPLGNSRSTGEEFPPL